MPHRLFHVELPIHPGWEAIDPMRVSVLACANAIFSNGALATSIGVVTAELLENALKFGRWEAARPAQFRLRIDGHDDRVEIEVSNPVAPGEENVERLMAELARIARSPSPEEAYTKRVRGVVLGKPSSGLGLARAAHEGGCDLSAEVSGNMLHVRAVTRRLAPPRPTPAPA
ncbi:MAG TPA: hypothetical protein VIW03_05305 [Anaeromyxobacter sp.]